MWENKRREKPCKIQHLEVKWKSKSHLWKLRWRCLRGKGKRSVGLKNPREKKVSRRKEWPEVSNAAEDSSKMRLKKTLIKYGNMVANMMVANCRHENQIECVKEFWPSLPLKTTRKAGIDSHRCTHLSAWVIISIRFKLIMQPKSRRM